MWTLSIGRTRTATKRATCPSSPPLTTCRRAIRAKAEHNGEGATIPLAKPAKACTKGEYFERQRDLRTNQVCWRRARTVFFHGGTEIRLAAEKFDLGSGLRTAGYAPDGPEENEEREHRQERKTSSTGRWTGAGRHCARFGVRNGLVPCRNCDAQCSEQVVDGRRNFEPPFHVFAVLVLSRLDAFGLALTRWRASDTL